VGDYRIKEIEMKKLTVLLAIIFFLAGCSNKPENQGTAAERAVRELVGRILPDYQDKFVFKEKSGTSGKDFFELQSFGDQIIIRAPDAISMAAGLNWYLKYYCNTHISFTIQQVTIPDPLPRPAPGSRKELPFKYRYFFNYCTFSYTMAWWDWPQWERMIDWMALNGVNMPLAVTGQEAVWQNVLTELGLSKKQISDFLVGPAYFPWAWMGNIEGLGGPLPQTWIDSHIDLQKKILQRERSLGMRPVLQGFTGHVPLTIKEKFPEATLHQTGDWSAGFSGTYFLDPFDPLFEKIGKLFIEKQTEMFGTDHLYAADTFNEMDPPTTDPDFLASMSRTVYKSMQVADSQAVWIMQGWFLYYSPNKFWTQERSRALLQAVPGDRMIVLDLFGDQHPIWQKFNAFYGKPWIWNIVHNFGGKTAMNGNLSQISQNLSDAVTSSQRGDFSGIGMMMESFGNNPVIQDFVMDMIWRDQIPDPQAWIKDFARRRYGSKNPDLLRVWQMLLETVYSSHIQSGSRICDRPGLTDPKLPYRSKPYTEYDPVLLARACELFLSLSNELEHQETYQFDAVNITRQVLSNLSNTFVKKIDSAYYARDKSALQESGRILLDLINDLDDLLATRKEFLLGKWIAQARGWGTNEAESNLYEWNARNLITLWGEKCTEGQFDDLNGYALKQWSGLFKGYYLPRWKRFLELLKKSLESDQPFVRDGYLAESCAWEKQWSHQHEVYPAEPKGDAVRTCRRLFEKYRMSIYK